MTQWLLVLLGVALTLGTGIFVAAEFALVTLDRSAVERAVADGRHRAAPVVAALRQLSTQLSACQIGITCTTLLLGLLAQPGIAALLKPLIVDVGLAPKVADTVALVVALLLATGFSMVFGELVPKNLALATPLATATLVAPAMRIATLGFGPLIRVLNGSANSLLRRVGVEPQEELSGARTPQELASLVRRSAAAGTLGHSTAELVTRSLDFASRTAADVMTPRLKCAVIERTQTAADVVSLARSTGYSRFLVIGQGLDDVRGVVHLKRAVSVPPERRREVPAAALMSTHLTVPETVGLDPLLAQLRAETLQLAVVIDEYGGTSGVVTLEDVVEELVG
ncbi:MAG: hemolysin family protein, partial [Angustibacter sp.]